MVGHSVVVLVVNGLGLGVFVLIVVVVVDFREVMLTWQIAFFLTYFLQYIIWTGIKLNVFNCTLFWLLFEYVHTFSEILFMNLVMFNMEELTELQKCRCPVIISTNFFVPSNKKTFIMKSFNLYFGTFFLERFVLATQNTVRDLWKEQTRLKPYFLSWSEGQTYIYFRRTFLREIFYR